MSKRSNAPRFSLRAWLRRFRRYRTGIARPRAEAELPHTSTTYFGETSAFTVDEWDDGTVTVNRKGKPGV